MLSEGEHAFWISLGLAFSIERPFSFENTSKSEYQQKFIVSYFSRLTKGFIVCVCIYIHICMYMHIYIYIWILTENIFCFTSTKGSERSFYLKKYIDRNLKGV